MINRPILLTIATALAAGALAACDTTTDTSPASASNPDYQKVNPDCRPGNTPAGTASGLHCTPGSDTGQQPGIDSNVSGASTQGQAVSPPEQ